LEFSELVNRPGIIESEFSPSFITRTEKIAGMLFFTNGGHS
jgi:hypothetical protein